jgi:iron complex transport system permease protein
VRPAGVGGTVAPPRGAGRHRRLSGARFVLLLLALAGALVVAVLLAISLGAVDVPIADTARVVGHHLFPRWVDPLSAAAQDQIIWNLRVPRVLLGPLVGAGLALVGAVLQALVRNQLADPYLLGISSGAAFGAVLVLVFGAGTIGGLSLSGAAFLGGVSTTFLVYLLAQRRGHVTPSRLILAGVALGYLFTAGYGYVIYTSPNEGQQPASTRALVWMLGSLGSAKWSTLVIPALVLLCCFVALQLRAGALNALLAGEETARSLGVDVGRVRLEMLAVTALLTGVMVAVSGAVAFVGLVIPHVVRMVVGADHRRLLPAAALTGAVFMVLVDLAARTVERPNELPLSIVTATVGAPFFVWLLRRQGRIHEEALG